VGVHAFIRRLTDGGLCILANGAPDAPTQSERRGDLSLAWWSRSGRSHLVIGHVPEERAITLARMIEKQV
jgi:hypothetical protein